MVKLTCGIAMLVRCRSPGIINTSIVLVFSTHIFLSNLKYLKHDGIKEHHN